MPRLVPQNDLFFYASRRNREYCIRHKKSKKFYRVLDDMGYIQSYVTGVINYGNQNNFYALLFTEDEVRIELGLKVPQLPEIEWV